jgi:site-specific recombinase XerD
MRFRCEAKVYLHFQRSVGDQDLETIDQEAVAAFLYGKGPITANWHRKYVALRGMFRFALAREYLAGTPLPTTLPKCPEPRRPYIYSTEELERLLLETDTLENPQSPLRAATFRALILTLYGTGLRIGEALSLTIADVNLLGRLITVRESKFYKTRLVPIGPKLTNHLQSYLIKRRQLPCPSGEDSAFFATRTGKALFYERVRGIFHRLRNQAGIRGRDGISPRIHDLRHTFAVHRLELWYSQGADVQRMLPFLSTYLGHSDVSHTQRYLQMTPNILSEACKRFENYALSEVTHG